jgi:uncharacterized Zn-binding protein involved in type VI secretion
MRFFTALSLAFLLGGCNLLDRLQNNVILVAMLVQSPAPPAGGPISGSPVVLTQLYLAQKSGDLTSPPSEQSLTPITNATVALLDNGVQVATLAGMLGAPGYYESTSVTYIAGHTYRFTATVGADQYWAEVANVPAAPALTVPLSSNHRATYGSYNGTPQFSNPYPITRTGNEIAFYGVWTVSGTTFDPGATANCSNLPQTAGDLLTLIFVNDAPYRVATFDVPKATCFPAPSAFPGNYVVGLSAVKRGTTSSNLAIYSAALAGTSDAVLVSVTGP